MDLSKKDRIILVNQYEILKFLNPDDAEYYDESIEILRFGYTPFYDEIASSVDDSEISQEKCDLVFNILNIYRIIESYRDAIATNDEVTNHTRSKFRGFDGNNETQYMIFANFLFKQGKYTETSRHSNGTNKFNSHMPTLHIYKSMIAKWNEFGNSFELEKDQILEILEASKV